MESLIGAQYFFFFKKEVSIKMRNIFEPLITKTLRMDPNDFREISNLPKNLLTTSIFFYTRKLYYKIRKHKTLSKFHNLKFLCYGAVVSFLFFNTKFLARRVAWMLSNHRWNLKKFVFTLKDFFFFLKVYMVTTVSIGLAIKGKFRGVEKRSTVFYIKRGRTKRLQTIQNTLDYTYTCAKNKLGIYGIKVWLFD